MGSHDGSTNAKDNADTNNSTNDNSHNNATITPLPADQIMCVLFIQLCEALNINVLFPFMAFMVEDFGYSGELLGYYVGGLAAAFCSAQFFSSVFWGKISDVYGRKPAMLIGTIGTVFGMLVFGLAKSYTQAVLGRVIAGLLSGNIGVLKTYITEITDDSNRAAGFSYLSIAWACGCIIAPLFGGVLSKPVEKYPKYFKKGGIFDTFPYFLPILLCVILLLISIVMCILFMKETRVFPAPGESNVSSKTKRDSGKELLSSGDSSAGDGIELSSMASTKDVRRSDTAYAVVDNNDDDDDEEECFLCAMSKQTIYSAGEVSSNMNVGGSSTSPLHSSQGLMSVGSIGASRNRTSSSIAYEKVALDRSSHFVIEEDDEDDTSYDDVEALAVSAYASRDIVNFNDVSETGDSIARSDSLTQVNLSNKRSRTKNVLRQRVVVLACCNYMVLCMSFILFDETLPLFLKLSISRGGFSFDSMNIGSLLSATGVFLLVFACFVLPKVGRYSKKSLFHYSLLAVIAHVFFWPLAGRFHYYLMQSNSPHTANLLVYPLLFVLLSTKTAMASCAFMASTIQVNHSVHGENLGTVNGFGQALGAFARGIGPALGGVLWSTSTKYNFVYLNFLAVAVLWLVNMYINSILPLSLDMKKRRKGETGENPKEDVMEAREEVTIEF